MGAADQLRNAAAKARKRYDGTFRRLVDLAHDSITVGSPLTGAPGQPVGTGTLRDSWEKSYPAPNTALIATSEPYARQEEDGISYAHGGKSPIDQHSGVGGPHSLKLTVAGMQRLLDAAVEEELRAEP